MIRFRQFLIELPYRLQWSKDEAQESHIKAYKDLHNPMLIDKDWNGYKIYRSRNGKGEDIIVTDSKKHTHIWLNVNTASWRNPKYLLVYVLKATKINQIRAHKFYAHLVNLGYIIVSGDEQTKGGETVWRRLDQEPGIIVDRVTTTGFFTSKTEVKPKLSRWRDHYNNYYGGSTRFIAYKKGTAIDDSQL